MLESLSLTNFTAFSRAEFEFTEGLNVILGENGSGKTHILKAAYSLLYVCARGGKESGSSAPTKTFLQTAVAAKLNAVFKPDTLGRLARRIRRGRQRCEIRSAFSPLGGNELSFNFSSVSGTEVVVEAVPTAWLAKLPVYLPTRELLTIYPGFVSLYETTHLPFEETWRDACLLLGAPLARGPRQGRINELLVPLEAAMRGKVELDDAGRFYLNLDGASMEMHLVAEGLRKLAMIARLIATGALVDKGYLFWDEPEANLNPKIIKLMAKTILNLCRGGIQVFIASHSLFLLRELDILRHQPPFQDVSARFFGLHPDDKGVEVKQGEDIEDIGEIDALQEELSQSDRYLEAEAK